MFVIPKPENEPILSYAPGSPERAKAEREISAILGSEVEIPLVIGGKNVKTGDFGKCIVPHDHKKAIGRWHRAGKSEALKAVKASLAAREKWAETPFEHRASIFLKAAELLSKKYRYKLDAATMLVHSKNAYQAEIDVCELIDFWRFNVYFAQDIYSDQPNSPAGMYNRMEYRPLEGFVLAITPFNFLAIGGNLPTAPAIMGNVAIWKPASSVVYSNYLIMQLLVEAGVPPGVINFLPGNSSVIGDALLRNEHLAGVHFTGSTAVMQGMFETVGREIKNYKSYPKIVGETGGKDFVFIHSSADPKAAEIALVRGSFEYQGQKCSAASRAYIPESLWPAIKDEMLKDMKSIRVGPVTDYKNFVNAVIDEAAFKNIVHYIEKVKKSKDAEIAAGGTYDISKGYYIDPTVIEAKKPHYITMEEEIFGPVLTVYIYKDTDYEAALKLCNETSRYALTGAVFANDREAIRTAERILRDAVGNFYINDKPTGAVVGQQPFGGARGSGTNDKAGSKWNLIRWVSPRTIKETFNPPVDYRYPFMG